MMLVCKIKILLITALSLNNIEAFVLVDSCPAIAPCQCHGLGSLDCGFRRFNSFPQFKNTSTHVYSLFVNLQHNLLTNVPDYAFMNLGGINAKKCEIQLNYNKISSISPHAFSGVENMTTSLYLSSNKFTNIPLAINTLKQLQVLTLYENEITSIGDHDLTGLIKLQRLDISKNPILYISDQAFDNNNALTALNLDSTRLTTIPYAITSLNHTLSTLTIGYTKPSISCSCDMSESYPYLKSWNASAIGTLNGNCANSNTRLQDYIVTTLHQCP